MSFLPHAPDGVRSDGYIVLPGISRVPKGRQTDFEEWVVTKSLFRQNIEVWHNRARKMRAEGFDISDICEAVGKTPKMVREVVDDIPQPPPQMPTLWYLDRAFDTGAIVPILDPDDDDY
jgi:hypothetical protein